MKAKIKGTGEIVEVKQKGTVHISCPAYHTTDNRIIPSFALEFEKNIDWEKRRYEIAKDMMTAAEQHNNDTTGFKNTMAQAQYAIECANALIAELKKGGEQ